MKRALSVILSLLLLVSVTPVAFATGDGDAMDWAALKEALKAGGEITLQNDVAAPDGAGALSVPKSSTVTLDLNGHTVDRGLDIAKKKGCVIEVLGELTVTDTSAEQTGAITGGYTDGTGGGVWVRADGRFTLAGGAITGNTAKNVGGGVYLSGSGASFTMTGGAITGNAAKNGGGLAMDNAGSAEVSGGTISGNTANNNGGGVWFGRGTSFTLAGGSVTGNTAANQGGGVYINDGAFDYTGGSVADNQQAAGGDIAAKSGSYLPTFPVTVTVTVDENGNEGGTVTADKETAAEGDAAEEGGEVYTLTQSDADRFKSADPAYGIRLTENNTLELTHCYGVTVADDITNGTVTASPATAIPGTPVALTVTPDEDYAVDTVTVNGTEIEPVDGAYGFEMPEEDVTVSAAFVLSVSPDQAAANQVIRKIDAIGEVVYNNVCAGRIHAAREAYDELTDTQKALVTNYDVLTAAEEAYAALEDAACTITVIMDLQGKGENVTVKVAPGASVSDVLDKAFPDDLPVCYGFEVAGLSLHPMADDPSDEEIDAAANEILLFKATEDTTIYLVWRSTGELEGDLDDHVAAFEQAKVNAAGTLAELSQDGDSAACGRIIAAALEAMETLAYDYTVSPDENMAAVAAIVTQAETDLAAQRAADAEAQAAADREAADEVIGKIDAIGTVAYTEACKAKIDEASDAYDALTNTQKALVTNAQALSDAIDRYAEMKAQAEQEAADQAAADEVVEKIDAIGTVAYTEACKAKIDDANAAYDALTDAQKELVTNALTLTDAIARYAELKAQAETPTDPTDPTEPENPTEPTEPDTPSGENKCPWDDVDHGTSFWGRLVRFFHSILYFFAHLFGVR